MRTTSWSVVATACLALAATLLPPPARALGPGDPPPRVPPGFVITPFAQIDGVATSIDMGSGKTRGTMYVAEYGTGRVLRLEDAGGAGGQRGVFADGFSGPLGVLAAPDGTVYVTDSEGPRRGPFGNRVYGRVWRLRDRDGDGSADSKKIVLKDLPNGRHNTNGMALGADGMLYVANGNSTDDGVEGGEPEVLPWSGSVVRIHPTATGTSVTDLSRRRALVATGMRNLYDVAFSPVAPALLFIPTNGVDDARKGSTGGAPGEPIEDSDDLLYATDTSDHRADDFGFPSCLYNVERTGALEPYDNPNPDVIRAFGACPKRRVPRPEATFGLHPSADGLAFQVTDRWGESYANDLFVAEFGNFFGDGVYGHRVVRVELDERGRDVTAQSDFMVGPTALDVTFDDDGVMYVATFTGSILRVDKAV